VITASPSAESQVLIGVVDGEKLWVGPDTWQPWIFASGSPSSLSAAGGALWLHAQRKLLRFDGSWAEVRLPADATGSIRRALAHDGGVWVETDDSVCHVGAGAMVRVDGIRPFSRSKELDYDFFLSASDPEASLSASMDGETLLLSVDETTGLSKGKVRLDNVGWHELIITAGSAERRVPVKRLPEQERGWKADIEPIYQTHCSGSDCHSSSTTPAPKLDSYEAWLALAKKIEGRVVDARTMPPASSRGPDWSEAQVETIAQWLAGGMAP
jgi:hypothetical protein